jgi:hypothetical protein
MAQKSECVGEKPIFILMNAMMAAHIVQVKLKLMLMVVSKQFSILTEYQYPFFYTCDKSYNAYTGGAIENFDPYKQYPATDPASDSALPLADKIYKYGLWGYMGQNTSLCPPGNTP